VVNSPLQKFNGIKDHTDLAFADWSNFAQFGKGDILPTQWAKMLIEESNIKVYRWLKDRGVKFFPVVHWVERGLYRPGNSVPRFHLIWGTGSELIHKLKKRLYSHPKVKNLKLYFSHKVENFLIKNNRVEGVQGRNFQAYGSAIVIASGGYGGNLEYVKKNWPTYLGSAPSIMLNGSHKFSDGLLHQQIEKLNGQLTHMKKMWNYAAGVHHPRPAFENQGISLVPPRSALWLDAEGRRFGPRPLVASFDTSDLVEKICLTKQKYSWQILNYKIAKRELAVSGAYYNREMREKKLFAFLKTLIFGNKKLINHLIDQCPDFVVADSLQELALKMTEKNHEQAIDEKILKEEIESYDRQIQRGVQFYNDDQLRRIAMVRNYRGDRLRTCKFQRILDPDAFPLIAIREYILSRKSLGGIQTDLQSRVLNNQGHWITGVYAVGEAAGFGGGGIHGRRSLEGTFLSACLLTAQQAAASIKENI
jgi:predicted oxidoreductase